MTLDQIRAFLMALGVHTGAVSGAGWLESHCALAPWRHAAGVDKHPSFGVKLSSGNPRARCWSCGFTGNLGELLVELRHANDVAASGRDYDFATAVNLIAQADSEFTPIGGDIEYLKRLESPLTTNTVFPESWLDSFPKAYDDAGNIHPYLAKRGLTWEIARLLDLRCDTYRERVCFPIRDAAGALRGLHGRSFAGVDPKYLVYLHKGESNPGVWYGEQWLDRTCMVVMTESVFDLASVRRVYDNVVSPLTANIKAARLKRMSGLVGLVTLFDRDPTGDRARAEIDRFYKHTLVAHVIPPAPHKDGGDMPPEMLADLLGPHLALTPLGA